MPARVSVVSRDPLLAAAAAFALVALASLAGLAVHPWRPYLFVSAACAAARAAALVDQHGLLVLAPSPVRRALGRTVFENVCGAIGVLSYLGGGLLRVAMLACMDLDREQRGQVLEQMDPEFRRHVFNRPAAHLLPGALRRVVFGRSCASAASPHDEVPRSEAESGREAEPRVVGEGGWRRGCGDPSFKQCGSDAPDGAATATPSSPSQEPSSPSQASTSNAGSFFLEAASRSARGTGGGAAVAGLERILARKVAGSTADAARQIVGTACDQARDAYDCGREKAVELGCGAMEVAADRRTQVTAASAVGGAVALGAGGAATGLVSGTLAGAACGLVPALFTFGLSIPICAALGSGLGASAGAAVGGGVGLLGGGALGFRASSGAGEPTKAALADHLLDAQPAAAKAG